MRDKRGLQLSIAVNTGKLMYNLQLFIQTIYTQVHTCETFTVIAKPAHTAILQLQHNVQSAQCLTLFV